MYALLSRSRFKQNLLFGRNLTPHCRIKKYNSNCIFNRKKDLEKKKGSELLSKISIILILNLVLYHSQG